MAHHVLISRRVHMREIPISILGSDGRRKLENRTKTNQQLFPEYYGLVSATLSKSYSYESKRPLEKFRVFIGEYPPTTQLAVKFLGQFKGRKSNTRARYAYILSAFFNFYNGQRLPIKIKTPKILPQDVPTEDLERLENVLRGKQTHKKTIERDILLIQTGRFPLFPISGTNWPVSPVKCPAIRASSAWHKRPPP